MPRIPCNGGCGYKIKTSTDRLTTARCRACRRRETLERGRTPEILRALVYEHYGWVCACCKAETSVLTIDHVAGDGKKHRIDIPGGATLYRWLVDNEFPDGFQTLCRECNTSKGRGFTCALHDYKFLGPEELRFYFELASSYATRYPKCRTTSQKELKMAANPGRSPRPARSSASGRKGVANAGVDPTNQTGQIDSVLDGLTMTNAHTGLPGSSVGGGATDVTTQKGQLNHTIEGDNSNVTDTGLPGGSTASPNSGGETVTYTDAFAIQGYGNDAGQMSSPNALSGPNDSTGFAGNGYQGPTLPGLQNTRITDTGVGKGRDGKHRV